MERMKAIPSEDRGLHLGTQLEFDFDSAEDKARRAGFLAGYNEGYKDARQLRHDADRAYRFYNKRPSSKR